MKGLSLIFVGFCQWMTLNSYLLNLAQKKISASTNINKFFLLINSFLVHLDILNSTDVIIQRPATRKFR